MPELTDRLEAAKSRAERIAAASSPEERIALILAARQFRDTGRKFDPAEAVQDHATDSLRWTAEEPTIEDRLNQITRQF